MAKRGDGSIMEITKSGKSYSPKHWRVCVSLGVDPISGKRRKAQRNVVGSLADARRVRDDLRREHESGLHTDSSRVTFGEFIDTWQASRSVSRTTAKKDSYTIELLKSYLGRLRLREITPQVISSLYGQIVADKEAQGRPFGPTSLHHVHVTLKQVLRQAVMFDLLLRNPAERVQAPKAGKPDRRTLSIEEANRFLSKLNEAEDGEYRAFLAKERRQHDRGNTGERASIRKLSALSYLLALRLILASGIRRGEAFGATWEAFNAQERTFSVAFSLTPDGERKSPKSKAGYRTIPLDDATGEHLSAWKAVEAAALEMLGVAQSDDTPMFCSETGGFIGLHNFERWWRRFRDGAGFPDLKVHELRHTFASLLVGSGLDLKSAQTILGHSSASLTLDWYSHCLPENDRRAANIMGKLLAPANEAAEIIAVNDGYDSESPQKVPSGDFQGSLKQNRPEEK